jgi:hypothetical protein
MRKACAVFKNNYSLAMPHENADGWEEFRAMNGAGNLMDDFFTDLAPEAHPRVFRAMYNAILGGSGAEAALEAGEAAHREKAGRRVREADEGGGG